MACGKREALRVHAMDVAKCTWAENPKQTDWNYFIRTGAIKEVEKMPPNPLVQAELEKLDRGGRIGE